jgi:hypothetical protein
METCRCQLRLRTLSAGRASNHNSCSEVFYGLDLRDRLQVRLASERDSIQSGEQLKLTIALTNTSSVPLGLVFARRLAHHPYMYPGLVRVFDAEGIDRTAAGSVGSISGNVGDYLVVLAPRGTARYVISWGVGTVTTTEDAAGSSVNKLVPLPAGIYRLMFPLFFDQSLLLTEQQSNPFTTITVTATP